MVMEMSKTYQYRKVMKPLLERKRRARINKCLDDLKDLMVECLQQEGEHVTRLEKADILELTVEHMRKLKQRGALSLQAHSTAHVESFHSGYVHAADQITQVLLQQEQADEMGGKIMKFLSGRLLEMQHHLLAVAPPPLLPPPPPSANQQLLTSSSSSSTLSSYPSHLPALSPASSNEGCCFELNVTPRIIEKDCDGGGGGGGDGDGDDHHHYHLIDVTTVDPRGATVPPAVSPLSPVGAAAVARSPEIVWRPW